jgi:hypothetical protein
MLSGLIHIAHQRASLGTGYASVGVDLDSLHSREIDNQAAIAYSESGGAMASATDCQGQPLALTKIKSSRDVQRRCATYDQRRVQIVCAIANQA